jgi:hypothetical protein
MAKWSLACAFFISTKKDFGTGLISATNPLPLGCILAGSDTPLLDRPMSIRLFPLKSMIKVRKSSGEPISIVGLHPVWMTPA